MLKRIDEFGVHLAILGFRNVKITNAEHLLREVSKAKKPGVEVQLFDAKFVASWEHLYFGVLNAHTAFENGTNASKSLAMETMLYVSAQRQIRKATGLVGIRSESSAVAVVVFGKKPAYVNRTAERVSKCIDGERDDGVLALSEEKIKLVKKVFGITDTELATVARQGNWERALVDAVIERMSLLATQR